MSRATAPMVMRTMLLPTRVVIFVSPHWDTLNIMDALLMNAPSGMISSTEAAKPDNTDIVKGNHDVALPRLTRASLVAITGDKIRALSARPTVASQPPRTADPYDYVIILPAHDSRFNSSCSLHLLQTPSSPSSNPAHQHRSPSRPGPIEVVSRYLLPQQVTVHRLPTAHDTPGDQCPAASTNL